MKIEEQKDLTFEINEQIDLATKRLGRHVRIVILVSSIIGYLIGFYFNIWAAFGLMIVFSVVGSNVFLRLAEKHDFYGVQALERQRTEVS